ncbi:hypothetical protein [Micromonospora sp. NPDC048169]|uniref:hypothetical protein n=1 Tax=unclassified Micromonospora TaxID=2617518 RepID=UPI0033F8B45C
MGTATFARTAGGRGAGAFTGPSAGSSGSRAGGTLAGADETGRTPPTGDSRRFDGWTGCGEGGSPDSFTVHSW